MTNTFRTQFVFTTRGESILLSSVCLEKSIVENEGEGAIFRIAI